MSSNQSYNAATAANSTQQSGRADINQNSEQLGGPKHKQGNQEFRGNTDFNTNRGTEGCFEGGSDLNRGSNDRGSEGKTYDTRVMETDNENYGATVQGNPNRVDKSMAGTFRNSQGMNNNADLPGGAGTVQNRAGLDEQNPHFGGAKTHHAQEAKFSGNQEFGGNRDINSNRDTGRLEGGSDFNRGSNDQAIEGNRRDTGRLEGGSGFKSGNNDQGIEGKTYDTRVMETDNENYGATVQGNPNRVASDMAGTFRNSGGMNNNAELPINAMNNMDIGGTVQNRAGLDERNPHLEGSHHKQQHRAKESGNQEFGGSGNIQQKTYDTR